MAWFLRKVNLTPSILLKYRTGVQQFFCTNKNKMQDNNFETVFSLPSVKYISLINRLKVYHLFGTSIAIPGCGVLEFLNVVPSYTFLTTTYIGLTGATVLTLGTLSFKNVIGHLYISKDNQKIKISSVDFWGKRKDRIIAVEDWIPLLDMKPKTTDALFLTPQLTDGTKYKLPLKFGKVLDAKRMGQVLE